MRKLPDCFKVLEITSITDPWSRSCYLKSKSFSKLALLFEFSTLCRVAPFVSTSFQQVLEYVTNPNQSLKSLKSNSMSDTLVQKIESTKSWVIDESQPIDGSSTSGVADMTTMASSSSSTPSVSMSALMEELIDYPILRGPSVLVNISRNVLTIALSIQTKIEHECRTQWVTAFLIGKLVWHC